MSKVVKTTNAHVTEGAEGAQRVAIAKGVEIWVSLTIKFYTL